MSFFTTTLRVFSRQLHICLFALLALTSLGAYAAGGGSSGPAIVNGHPNYFTMKPVFVVNILDGDDLRFMQVAIDLMSMDAASIQAVQDHQAPIRHELLMLFAHRDITEVLGMQQREDLRKQALVRIQETLKKYANIDSAGKAKTEEGEEYLTGIQEVLFTSYVIQ